MSARRSDPIKKIVLSDGRVRYRFVIDVGVKPDGRRDQRTYTFDKLGEARTERARMIAERADGTLVKRDRGLTVAAYLSEWLDSKSGKKPATVRNYTDALKPVLDAYGVLPLQKLDAPHLEKLKRGMLAGDLRRQGRAGDPLSPRSVNLMLTVTTMALKAAHRRRLVSFNAGELVERVPSDPDAGADRSAWQTEHARTFLASVAEDRLQAAWLMALLGLRRGEVLGLRWSDLDLDGVDSATRGYPAGTPTLVVESSRTAVAGLGTVVGTPKSRRSARALPVPAMLATTLRALRARQAAERLAAGAAYDGSLGLVIVDELGHPPRPEWLSDRWRALVKKAGVPAMTLHGARHAAASLLADHGLPEAARMAWLGHTTPTVHRGYVHAEARTMIEAGEVFGKAFSGAV